jgi:hypothetical protein
MLISGLYYSVFDRSKLLQGKFVSHWKRTPSGQFFTIMMALNSASNSTSQRHFLCWIYLRDKTLEQRNIHMHTCTSIGQWKEKEVMIKNSGIDSWLTTNLQYFGV